MRHKRTGETRRSCRRMESVIGASEAKEEEREVVREQTRFGECLHSRSADYTRGIFQSIGFKEFHAYLVLPEDEKQEKKVSRSGELQRRHVLRGGCASLLHEPDVLYLLEKGRKREMESKGEAFKGMLDVLVGCCGSKSGASILSFFFTFHRLPLSVFARESFDRLLMYIYA